MSRGVLVEQSLALDAPHTHTPVLAHRPKLVLLHVRETQSVDPLYENSHTTKFLLPPEIRLNLLREARPHSSQGGGITLESGLTQHVLGL